MLKKYRLLTIVALLISLVWLVFFASLERRVTHFEGMTGLTVRVTSNQQIDCPESEIPIYVDNDVEQPTCNKISFIDPLTDKEGDLLFYPTIQGSVDPSRIKEGQLIRVNRLILEFEGEGGLTMNGDTIYFFNGYDRLNGYFISIAIFILLVVWITGFRGVKSIVSLVVSILIISNVIIPMVLRGYDPILTVSVIGFIMFGLLIYITNGVNKISSVAIIGAGVGILFAIIFTYIFGALVNISGYGEEIGGVLSVNSDFLLDIRGITLASFILGVLGVVDDAAVSQVATVVELKRAKKQPTSKEIYSSAMRVGSSHIGSLMNTLFLAYVASALPLMILLSGGDNSLIDILNSDLFAEEIIRTIVGSLGLLISIPASTFIASEFLSKEDVTKIEIDGFHGHTHSHN